MLSSFRQTALHGACCEARLALQSEPRTYRPLLDRFCLWAHFYFTFYFLLRKTSSVNLICREESGMGSDIIKVLNYHFVFYPPKHGTTSETDSRTTKIKVLALVKKVLNVFVMFAVLFLFTSYRKHLETQL